MSVLTTSDRYEIVLDFVVDGVSYNMTQNIKCGLTSTGHEDTACMATLQAKYMAADNTCYVDKRLLPDCDAFNCISYSAPEWNTGCWVRTPSMPQLITLPSAYCRMLSCVYSHFILAVRLVLVLAD